MTLFTNLPVARASVYRFIFCFTLGAILFAWMGSSVNASYSSPEFPILAIIGNGLLLLATVLAFGLFCFGMWMGWIGILALQQGCYPPSNSIVLCDTLWVNGWKAVRNSLAALMLAGVSFLTALGVGLEVTAFLNL